MLKSTLQKMKTGRNFSQSGTDCTALQLNRKFDKNWVLLKDATNETDYAYLQSTWIPHNEKFILAWTKKVKHFGHVATSRVEGGHATLKKWIALEQGTWEHFMRNWFSQLNSSAKK